MTDELERPRVGRRRDRPRHGERVRAAAAVVATRARPHRPRRRRRAQAQHRIETDDAQITVVDLHNLPDRAKRFVVGVTLRRAFDRKEQTGLAKPLLFVVLDELNKYAPRDGDSPIKEILLDVAERGRSLGIVLIGAQQTASEVERRIIANSSIRVVGRLDPAEATRPEYGFLPTTHQKRATIAKPGTMFVMQPEIPLPLVAEFPFPAWATRPSESGGDEPGRHRRGRHPRRSLRRASRGAVRILHTSDWHVGKTLRGASRLDEHRAVLAEIATIAAEEQRRPRARHRRPLRVGRAAARRATRRLGRAARAAGDRRARHRDRRQPRQPVRARRVVARVRRGRHHAARPRDPPGAAVASSISPRTQASGASVVLLPFVSQRYAIRTEQMLELDAAQAAGLYAERMRLLIAALSEGFRPDTINLVAAHCFVRGGTLGGGERDAQTIFDYSVEALHFPKNANYIALGHLHRTQRMAAPAPAWYAGSPIQVDFGEEQDVKHVLLVEAEAGVPARVDRARADDARGRCARSAGTLAELAAAAPASRRRVAPGGRARGRRAPAWPTTCARCSRAPSTSASRSTCPAAVGHDAHVAPRPISARTVRGVPRGRRGRGSAGRAPLRPALRRRDRGGAGLMRPIALHAEGFGVFREAVDIDFDGVDYFALVGPNRRRASRR